MKFEGGSVHDRPENAEVGVESTYREHASIRAIVGVEISFPRKWVHSGGVVALNALSKDVAAILVCELGALLQW